MNTSRIIGDGNTVKQTVTVSAPVSILDQLLIIKHALYDGEIRLAQDTVDELIQKLKAI